MLNKNIIWHDHSIDKNKRAALKGQKQCILWFTGLSGSGKSTIANAVEGRLYELGVHTYLLDGDNVRLGLNKDLGFDEEDRKENLRRVGEVSKLFVDAGLIVLTAFISPYRKERELIRSLVEEDEFIEIFVDTPLDVCEQRDPKGLYKKARKGEIKQFTGLDAPYEEPLKPELHIRTDKMDVGDAVNIIISFLKDRGFINA